jgi:hypothetical protein
MEIYVDILETYGTIETSKQDINQPKETTVQTIIYQGIQWESMDDSLYCADGDGIVVVEKSLHNYIVYDQGDFIMSTTDGNQAFGVANKILKENYIAIYEEVKI